MAMPLPSAVTIAPAVVDTALAVGSSRALTRCGRAALSADSTKAAQRQHYQCAGVERLPVQSAEERHPDADAQPRPGHVAQYQHPLAPPPVQQDPGERADERVRQQQHRETCRQVGSACLPLGVEEHGAGQAGLKDPVAELAREPHREQPPERCLPEQAPQVPGTPHPGNASAAVPGPTSPLSPR